MSGWIFRVGGAFCLIICGWCMGDGICVRVQEHQKALQKTIMLLNRICQEIEFRRTDTGVLLRSLKKEEVVGQAVESLQTIPPFPQLTRREKNVFRECVDGIGHLEAVQECQRLNFYCKQFEVFRNELQPSMRTTMELSHKIGLALGLAAAVLLL